MAIRNFYMNANVDGRVSRLTGGPRNKEGGMSIIVTQRENKTIKNAVRVCCDFDPYKNKLVTTIYDNKDNLIFTYETDR